MAAQDLRRAGRFEAMHALLQGEANPVAVLERARCCIILGRPLDARPDLEMVVASGSPEEREFARAMLSCLGEPIPELTSLARAGCHIDDAVYYAALAHYRADNAHATIALIESHTPKNDVERARYLVLRGSAKALLDDYVGQANDCEEALKLLLALDVEETYYIAVAAYTLAALARELPILPDHRQLIEVERSLQWLHDQDEREELRPYHFQILRTLGWRASAEGRVEDAITFFAKAGFQATTPTLRAFAHLDRAEAATLAGEIRSATVERAMAITALDSIDWSKVHDESMAVLATAARVLASHAPETAVKYATLAQNIATQMDPGRWAFAHGPRFQAFINEGIAFALASDDPQRALEAGRAAFEVFRSIGYGWRAIRLADLLFAMTGSTMWRRLAAPIAQLYPRRYILDRADKPMTPHQQAIADRIVMGQTFEKIGLDLGISESTVKTLAQRMYSRFGANDRQEFEFRYSLSKKSAS